MWLGLLMIWRFCLVWLALDCVRVWAVSGAWHLFSGLLVWVLDCWVWGVADAVCRFRVVLLWFACLLVFRGGFWRISVCRVFRVSGLDVLCLLDCYTIDLRGISCFGLL